MSEPNSELATAVLAGDEPIFHPNTGKPIEEVFALHPAAAAGLAASLPSPARRQPARSDVESFAKLVRHRPRRAAGLALGRFAHQHRVALERGRQIAGGMGPHLVERVARLRQRLLLMREHGQALLPHSVHIGLRARIALDRPGLARRCRCPLGGGVNRTPFAVARQLGTLAHYSNFGDFASDVTLQLAEELGAIAPVPGSKIFFTSGGSDSVDSAIKLARRYWQEQGRPEKKLIVGRSNAYHGMHVAGTSLAGIPLNHDGYGELMHDVQNVDWDDAKSLLGLIERVGADNIAAFFCEPIIGAGGIYLPPEGYLAEVRGICRDHDILFVVDEVVTGFRLGMGGAQGYFGVTPDLTVLGKAVSGGYPMAGGVGGRPLELVVRDSRGKPDEAARISPPRPTHWPAM